LAAGGDLRDLHRAPDRGLRWPSHDAVHRRGQLQQAWEAARKDKERSAPVGQLMLLQQRLGCGTSAKLIERQGAQEMRRWRPPPPGEPVEEDERPLRVPVEHRRHGGHQQKLEVGGTGRNRRLRERQDRCARFRVRERPGQPLDPDLGWVERLLEQVPLAQCRTCHRPRRPPFDAPERSRLRFFDSPATDWRGYAGCFPKK